MKRPKKGEPGYKDWLSGIRRKAAKKAYHDNPGLVETRRKQMKTRYENPEERKKTSEQQIERWSDPEKREKQSQKQLDFIETNPEITEVRAQASRDYWSDNSARLKKSEDVQELWQDEEFRNKQHQARLGNTNAKGNSGKPKSEKWKQQMAGSGNPNWRDGASFKPYDTRWTPEFKETIRNRQYNQCADKDDTCKHPENIALHVHHIDGNKLNSIPENCIALCISHHGKAQFDNTTQLRYKAFVADLM